MPRRIPRVTCALGCDLDSKEIFIRPDRKRTNHRFPLRNEDLLNKWLSAVDKPDWYPTQNSWLCSRHFEDKCFHPSQSGNKYFLDRDAVPTLFLNDQNAESDEDGDIHSAARMKEEATKIIYVEPSKNESKRGRRKILKQENKNSTSRAPSCSDSANKRKRKHVSVEEDNEQELSFIEENEVKNELESVGSFGDLIETIDGNSSFSPNNVGRELEEDEEMICEPAFIDTPSFKSSRRKTLVKNRKCIEIEEGINFDDQGMIELEVLYDDDDDDDDDDEDDDEDLVDLETNDGLFLETEDYCRLCANKKEEMLPLFKVKLRFSNKDLMDVIDSCTGVKVSKDDGMSNSICELCLSTVESIYVFRKECVNADMFLRHKQSAKNRKEPSKDRVSMNGKNFYQTSASKKCVDRTSLTSKRDRQTSSNAKRVNRKVPRKNCVKQPSVNDINVDQTSAIEELDGQTSPKKCIDKTSRKKSSSVDDPSLTSSEDHSYYVFVDKTKGRKRFAEITDQTFDQEFLQSLDQTYDQTPMSQQPVRHCTPTNHGGADQISGSNSPVAQTPVSDKKLVVQTTVDDKLVGQTSVNDKNVGQTSKNDKIIVRSSSDEDEFYPCLFCKKEFASENVLDIHVEIMHKNKVEKLWTKKVKDLTGELKENFFENSF